MWVPFHILVKATSISVLFLALIIWATFVFGGTPSKKSSLPAPDASLQPEEVVKIVVSALANNDDPYPDAGIETTFKFASPANKFNTGPLERFASMVKGPIFGVMLNHKKSDFSEVVRRESSAYQMVRLLTRDNQEVHFAFRLGLQLEGEYKGMWMTEAVWPLQSTVEGIAA